jgi:hypothetical protein
MAERRRYWFLAPADEDEAGRLPPAEVVLSEPWWPEAVKWTHEKADEYVEPPMLFSTRAAAVAEMREIHDAEPDDYLRMEREHGGELMDRALDNTAPLRVFAIERDSFAEKLNDSDFLCVLVDGRMRLQEDFIEELMNDA